MAHLTGHTENSKKETSLSAGFCFTQTLCSRHTRTLFPRLFFYISNQNRFENTTFFLMEENGINAI